MMGGADVYERGFVWSTEHNPSVEFNEGYAIIGIGTGEFSYVFTDLSVNTPYYIRAYAINSEGTSYSEERILNLWDYHGTVTDFDGNIYHTVMIGDQEWMAENLKVSRYRNGIPIQTGLSNEEWLNTSQGAYAIYPHEDVDGIDFDEEIIAAYGKLYNWYAVNDSGGICPIGWHVPSDDEWTELVNYLMTEFDLHNESEYKYIIWAGNALKSCRQADSPLGGECNTSEHPRWGTHEIHYGFDIFGFSALPGGYRTINGSFRNLGTKGYWWSSTETSSWLAWQRYMGSNHGSVYRHYDGSKGDGFSIRCLRDLD